MKPEAPIDLYCEDHIAQHGLEPVLLDGLPPEIRAVLDATVVRRWDTAEVVADGHHVSLDAQIGLIDPVQLALEIDDRRDRIAVRRGERANFSATKAISHLEFVALPVPLAGSSLLEATAATDLAVPVLADFDVARPQSLYLQYFPLARGQVLVRQIALAGLELDQCNPAKSILRHSAMANRAIDQAVRFVASISGGKSSEILDR